MPTQTTTDLLQLSQHLLDSIDRQDWDAYRELCDPTLTAYEPEALGHLVEGLEFHHFYFDKEGGGRKKQSSICSPHVRVMSDVAVVTYVRLVQTKDESGQAATAAVEETRIWQLQDDAWKHVHFHRSHL